MNIIILLAATLWLGQALPVSAAETKAETGKHATASGEKGGNHEGHGHAEGDDHAGDIHLSNEQVQAGDFDLQKVGSAAIGRRTQVPGTITPSSDHIARIAVRLVGTVSEIRKRLADPVKVGEVVAIIESREVADAKSEYLAAETLFNLQDTLFQRSKRLFEGSVLSENEYLRARSAHEDVRIKRETARQKLFALGLDAAQIKALPQQPAETLRLQELRSPIEGKVAERRVELGALVGREGQESELFVIVDTSTVWVELAVAPVDLPLLREGQLIDIRDHNKRTQASVMYVSPLLNPETRAARVIASITNPDNLWRPGAFVTAEIAEPNAPRTAIVPRSSVQSIDGKSVVFVRTEEGFERRDVVTGASDASFTAITSGISEGEFVASRNTFVLKAELGKAGVDHVH